MNERSYDGSELFVYIVAVVLVGIIGLLVLTWGCLWFVDALVDWDARRAARREERKRAARERRHESCSHHSEETHTP